MDIAFSPACENNKVAILSILREVFKHTDNVLEIGSGTGQHAQFFAEHLSHLQWQPSDLLVNHPSISFRREQYIESKQLNSEQAQKNNDSVNLLAPIEVDLNSLWNLAAPAAGIFTANTLHIVSWPLVKKFFSGVGKNLMNGGMLCIYGPFNYEGKYTSESNAEFDLWLKDRDINSAIRDFDSILLLANSVGLSLIEDNAMPANNRLLTFVMN